MEAAGEQQLGVEVARTEPDTEVKSICRRPDHRVMVNALAPGDRDAEQERRTGAQSVGVEHHHVKLAADLPGKRDDPDVRGADRRVGADGVVNPSVAGSPSNGRWSESVNDRPVNRRSIRR
jgi:hypothetical protein